MAKNITLMGASYSDVPAVVLPQTGGGTARFDDTSVTTAVASDVAQGKVFVASDGTITTGTNSGGGGGGDPAVWSDVNFIDYDGTLVDSYTASEFANLTALPANPSHTGLTAQGWNWSLSDAKTYVASYGKLIIGQMYITDNRETRIYCHFEKGRLAPYLGIGVNGTVTVNWGDGSNTTTLTGSSLTTVKTAQHTYASEGDYVIRLTVNSGSFSFFGTSNTSHILKKDTVGSAYVSRAYTNAIRKIEIGGSARIGNYAFIYCHSLASITIPSSVTSIGTYAFRFCYNLLSITIPNGITSIGAYMANNCSSLLSVAIPNSVTNIENYVVSSCSALATITIPSSVTSIGTYVFSSDTSFSTITIPDSVTSIENNLFAGCYPLASVTISDSVTSIGASAFSNCYCLGEIHFLPTTPPTLANTNAFNNVPYDCIFYVPSGSLNAYQTATNWSTYASRMVGE